MNSFRERLFNLYNIDEEKYLELTRSLSKEDLEKEDNFLNVDIAKMRIEKAIENKEKIMIYGDYDCDGITSTSILVYTFKKMKYDNVGYYIPSRYQDGYGINVKMVELVASKGYSVIITVDNGVAQFDALKRAKELNIDVILTDHHEIKETIPDNYTIIHPTLKKDGSNLAQCGAYVAFNLSRALLNETDDYLLSLASLATISDMMPLRGYNRDIVRVGLDTIKKNHYMQFEMLFGNKTIEDEKSLSYTIAPKINSLGRVLETNKVNKGVEFFTCFEQSKIIDIYRLIEFTNEKRKFVSNEAVGKINYDKYKDKIFIIDCFNDVIEGLIGLIANKALNEANKPAIIFTKDHKTGLLKGSARSLPGLPLTELFSQMPDLIVQYGGHALAGGLAIEESNLEKFIIRVNEIAKNYQIKEKEKKIIHCTYEDFTIENYKLIRSLSPYGEEFDEPYLAIEIPCKNIGYISNGKHIKGNINFGCSFIGFNFNKDYGRTGNALLIGKLNKDSFKNNNILSFQVEEVRL